MHCKACKLAKIQFNRDDSVVILEVDKKEVEEEKQKSLDRIRA